MIVYFADRSLNVLGQASTGLPGGVTITDDRKSDDVETGVSIFECKLHFDKKTRLDVEAWAEVGNYLLYSGKENKFYTIIDAEIDTKKQTAYVYAEDDGMDLLNDVASAYTADKAYPIAHYINLWAAGAGWEIGINEIENLERQLSWDSESTATARIASIAEQFDNAEISYSFTAHGLNLVKKHINIYQKRGTDNGVTLRLNYEIDSIVIAKSISNLATALHCTGGTPDDAETAITLEGYTYDDGDFYVDGAVLKSRNALDKWSRYFWRTGQSDMTGGHITKMFSCDALSKDALFAAALDELKKCRDMEVNYEAEIKKLPDNLEVGDRVNIVDDAGLLYLSTRLLTLETSVSDQTCSAVFGEYIIKGSGISEKVAALAAQFAASSKSVARAVKVATNAKATSDAAQEQAEAAAAGAENANTVANEAKAAAETATQSAGTAQAAADAAQAAVDVVEQSVSSLQTTVDNAQAAANNAHAAANTATEKAEEAKTAADKAAEDAATAKANAETAQSNAEQAIANAATAQTAAGDAKTAAENASATAAAAKKDAEQAEKDIAAFEKELETVTTTMQADYARKTELTETAASLQSQITQSAGLISSTVASVTKIDETANNAAELAETAQSEAAAAQAAADKATADATAAQTAANNAAAAAANAQSEADTAKTAAATAQGIADKAQEDLEAAQADLATVTSRVDATETEIAAAQAAVETAQAAADKAKEDATAAATKAETAQSAANSAASQAATAQTAANSAASQAAAAQKTADEAKGDASAAQNKANEAAATAAEAQRTASTATTNAANAQAAADAAAQTAATAQSAADAAAARAQQAENDLAAAQKDLADVTSRVGATEEEVAAAQAAVATAQTAANQAKQDAATAQSTADTAKANAATAQDAANAAQSAADAAQSAADAAQAAADKAQTDVNNLTTRVSAAETAITQTNEQIALKATKADVEATLGGYYTKEQTVAEIEAQAEEISLTVKKTVDDIKIGSRNLLPNSTEFSVHGAANGISYSKTDYGYLRIEAAAGNGNWLSLQIGSNYAMVEDELTNADLFVISFTMRSPNSTTLPRVYIKDGMGYYQLEGNLSAEWSTVWYAGVWKDANLITPHLGFSDCIGIYEIKNCKIERGTKVTDWTPAPEDVQDGIDDAQTTANDVKTRLETAESTIKQLADSISSLVRSGESGSLLKQDATGLWYFDISGIEKDIETATSGLSGLESGLQGANEQIDVLNLTAADLQERTEYVRSYTDENDNPCLELGEGDSRYKVFITNMGVRMEDGTDAPAVVSKKVLQIEKTVVRDELQFGDEQQVNGIWFWKRRSNGNLGLSWKSQTLAFSIDGVSYTADVGMTWAEWCDSRYNTDGCFYDNDYVYVADQHVICVDNGGGPQTVLPNVEIRQEAYITQ